MNINCFYNHCQDDFIICGKTMNTDLLSEEKCVRYRKPCAVCFAFPCMYLYIRNDFWIYTICNVLLCARRLYIHVLYVEDYMYIYIYVYKFICITNIKENDTGDESAHMKWHPKRSLIHFWWHYQYTRNLSEASSLTSYKGYLFHSYMGYSVANKLTT